MEEAKQPMVAVCRICSAVIRDTPIIGEQLPEVTRLYNAVNRHMMRAPRQHQEVAAMGSAVPMGMLIAYSVLLQTRCSDPEFVALVERAAENLHEFLRQSIGFAKSDHPGAFRCDIQQEQPKLELVK